MQLIDQFQYVAENDESIFQRQLAKEDIVRLDKLSVLLKGHAEYEGFRKEGLYIGWTKNDMKTHELRDVIGGFLEAYFLFHKSDQGDVDERRLEASWNAFHHERMEKLVHCL